MYSHSVFQKQVYYGLLEILKDDRLYYKSMIGTNYHKLTDDGKEALLEYITMMAPHIIEREKQNLEKLAKEMTWDELKK